MYYYNSKNERHINPTIHAKTVISPRLAWMMYYKEVQCVKKVCDKFGISRKTFYKWWNRYYNSNYDPKCLLDNSRKPHHSPMATPEDIIQKVIEAKMITGYGQRKLREFLIKNFNITLSEHTIWKLLKKHFGNDTFSITNSNDILKIISPGDCVQINIMELNNFDSAFNSVIYTAVDEATCLRISKIYPSPSLTHTSDFLNSIILNFPFKIKKIKTPDNLIFKSINIKNEIELLLVDQPAYILKRENIEQIFLREIELTESLVSKIHLEDKIQFFYKNKFRSLDILNDKFNHYLQEYNNHLKNEVLKGLTPLQKLRSFPDFKTVSYFE